MKKLIKSWEKLADKYYLQAQEGTNAYTIERLFASSETLRLCADQLRHQLQEIK